MNAPSLPDWPVLITVMIDTRDPKRLAAFWSALLHVEIVHETDEEIALGRQPDRGVRVSFQRVEEPAQGNGRVHVDTLVRDLAAARQRVVELGGSVHDEHERDGYVWAIAADPEGNRLCLIQPPPAPQ